MTMTTVKSLSRPFDPEIRHMNARELAEKLKVAFPKVSPSVIARATVVAANGHVIRTGDGFHGLFILDSEGWPVVHVDGEDVTAEDFDAVTTMTLTLCNEDAEFDHDKNDPNQRNMMTITRDR